MRIRTTNWNAIATSAPPDRTASVVRDGSAWEPEVVAKASVPAHHYHEPSPPPMKRSLPGEINLRGRRFGRFVVVGLMDTKTGNGARWVCRCTCGMYETRRAKTVQSGGSADHMCFVCFGQQKLAEQAPSKSTRATREADAARLDALAAKTRAP